MQYNKQNIQQANKYQYLKFKNNVILYTNNKNTISTFHVTIFRRVEFLIKTECAKIFD